MHHYPPFPHPSPPFSHPFSWISLLKCSFSTAFSSHFLEGNFYFLFVSLSFGRPFCKFLSLEMVTIWKHKRERERSGQIEKEREMIFCNFKRRLLRELKVSTKSDFKITENKTLNKSFSLNTISILWGRMKWEICSHGERVRER